MGSVEYVTVTPVPEIVRKHTRNAIFSEQHLQSVLCVKTVYIPVSIMFAL